ncbi:hypothetical protein LSTR_LSTR005634 [Laodelphax striatellus]|uniref:Uncharacterized protein n=1 Tax=Laodelphax striatellus TaxID=195883 RepID=A0A482WVJ8_LAOST|nr:hypothetical protein LSTR_LSTR005634 [Laodelphax striatellus]
MLWYDSSLTQWNVGLRDEALKSSNCRRSEDDACRAVPLVFGASVSNKKSCYMAVGTRPVLVVVLLLLTGLAGASVISCLKGEVSRALHRLATSQKHTFYLLDGLHLDRKAAHNDSNAAGTSKQLALADQTDRLFDDHDLLLDLAPQVQLKVSKAADGNYALSMAQPEGRTFGIAARKRLQMALLPIMYKLGVITTLLVGLTVLTLKAITIGVVLLILAFGGIFTKFKSSPWDEHHGGHHKDVHIHVHAFSKPAQWYKSWHRDGAQAQDYDALDSKTVNSKVPAPASYHHQLSHHQPTAQSQYHYYQPQHYNTPTSQTYPSSFGQLID